MLIQLKPGRLTAERGPRLRFTILMLLVLTAVFACYFALFRNPLEEAISLPGELPDNMPQSDREWTTDLFADAESRSGSPQALFLSAAAYGVPYSLIPWNTEKSLVSNVRCDRQERVINFFPTGDTELGWAPAPTMEIFGERYSHLSNLIPSNLDKSLINVLPSNHHKIRFDDLP